MSYRKLKTCVTGRSVFVGSNFETIGFVIKINYSHNNLLLYKNIIILTNQILNKIIYSC